MPAGNFVPYSNAIEKIVANKMMLPVGEFYAVLLKDTYQLDKTTHGTFADLRSHLCTNKDFSPVPVRNMAVHRNGDTVNIVCESPVSFGDSVSITAKYFAIVAGNHASPTDGDLLLGCCDLSTDGGSASSTSGPFTISIDTNGLFSIGN